MSKQWWIVAAVAAVVLWFFVSIEPVLAPFFVSMVLAYLGDPIADRLEERGQPRDTVVGILRELGFEILVAEAGGRRRALEPADLATLMDSVDLDSAQQIEIDLERQCVNCRAGTFAAQQPEDARCRLLEGSWDATGVLLEAADAIESTAAGLPYIEGF